MKYISFSILIIIFFTSCKKENTVSEIAETPGQATLTFDSKVGNNNFSLNTSFIIGNRTYKLNKLRYWVSNVTFINTKGIEYKVPDSYFLIEETTAISIQDGDYTYPAKKREEIMIQNIPVGDYKTIKFSIGVDAVHNNNLSLQAGELSQLNGMTNISWMWHTSYIFSSIGGTVKEGNTTKNINVETGLNTNYKTVSLSFPTEIHIGSAKPQAVVFTMDVSKLFNSLNLIAMPNIGASQASAMSQLSTNYTKAFSIASVKE